MKNPAVSVEVCGIVRLSVDCLFAHFAGILQFFAFQRKVVRIIVQYWNIVGIELEDFLVNLEGLLLMPHFVIGIA